MRLSGGMMRTGEGPLWSMTSFWVKKQLFHIKLEEEKVVMGLCLFLNDTIDTIFLLVSNISELMNSLLWDSALGFKVKYLCVN